MSNSQKSLNSVTSWQEYVKVVENDRKTLPWNSSEVSPVHHANTRERKLREREFNPVTMQFTNQDRESSYQKMKNELSSSNINTVKAVKESKYDIISHQGPPKESQTNIQSFEKHQQLNRPYHILSNMKHQDHSHVPLENNDDYIHTSQLKLTNPAVVPRGKQREFNVITNEFKNNHDEVMYQQYNRTKERILQKYWETHDYDMIKGKFFEPEKEMKFREDREQNSKTHGLNITAKLPKSLQEAEGQKYNILSCNMEDPATKEAIALAEKRAINRVRKSVELEKKITIEQDAKANIDDLRKINRINYHRWQDEADRGYDIVTTNSNKTIHRSVPNTNASSAHMSRPATDGKFSTMSMSDAELSTYFDEKLQSQRQSRAIEGKPSTGRAAESNQSNRDSCNQSRSSDRSSVKPAIPSLDLSKVIPSRNRDYNQSLLAGQARQLDPVVAAPKLAMKIWD